MPSGGPSGQRGAVLFVALAFLLILSLLAVAASSTSVLQERMAGSLRDSQLGLMGSESALRGTEFYVWSLSSKTNLSNGGLQLACGPAGELGNCFTRAYGKVSDKVTRYRSITGGTTSPSLDGSTPYAGKLKGLTGTEETASLADTPAYIMEDLDKAKSNGSGQMGGSILGAGGPTDPEDLHLYRITARSNGGTKNVVRVTESTYMALIPKSFGAN